MVTFRGYSTAVNEASDNFITVSFPTGLEVGWLLMVAISQGDEVITTPDDWALSPSAPVPFGFGSARKFYAFHRFVTESDIAVGEYTFALNTTAYAVAASVAFSGMHSLDPFDRQDTRQTTAVTWIDDQNVAIDGNNLTKNAGGAVWNAGAISDHEVALGDYYCEFTTDENNTNKMCGLSHGDTDWGFADIDFALYARSSADIEILESGVTKGTFGSYTAGDVFRVQVVNGFVTYFHNEALLYTSLSSPTYPLLVDCSLHNIGATLKDVQLAAVLQNSDTDVIGVLGIPVTVDDAVMLTWTFSDDKVLVTFDSEVKERFETRDGGDNYTLAAGTKQLALPAMSQDREVLTSANVLWKGFPKPNVELYLPGEPASGNVVGKLAATVLTPVNTPAYQQAFAVPAADSAQFDYNTTDSFDAANAAVHDFNNVAWAILVVGSSDTNPAGELNVIGKREAGGAKHGYELSQTPTDKLLVRIDGSLGEDSLVSPGSIANDSTPFYALFGMSISEVKAYLNTSVGDATPKSTSSVGNITNTAIFALGANIINAFGGDIAAVLIWSGEEAEEVLAARADLPDWWEWASTVFAWGLGIDHVSLSYALRPEPLEEEEEAPTDARDLFKSITLRNLLPKHFKNARESGNARLLAAVGESDNNIGGVFGKANFLTDYVEPVLYKTIEYVDYNNDSDTNTNNLDVPVPNGVQDDDFMLVGVAKHSTTGTGSISTPSGWTQLYEVKNSLGSGALVFAVYSRIASSEPASYNWSWAEADASASAWSVAYRNVDSTTPIADDNTPHQIDADPVMPALSVTPTVVPTYLVACHTASQSGGGVFLSTPDGMTLVVDASAATQVENSLFHELVELLVAPGSRTTVVSGASPDPDGVTYMAVLKPEVV